MDERKEKEEHPLVKNPPSERWPTAEEPPEDKPEGRFRRFLRIVGWEPFRGFHFLILGYGVVLLGTFQHGDDPRAFAVMLAGVITMCVGIGFVVSNSRRAAVITVIALLAYATAYAALVGVEEVKLVKKMGGMDAAYIASVKQPKFPGPSAVQRIQEVVFAPAMIVDSMLVRPSTWTSDKGKPELVPLTPSHGP